MSAKRTKTTKKKIVSAAWRLFYEQGYDNTTVDDIIEESGTSKGSFYHYFEGKDALLSSLSFLFDEKYEELMPTLDPSMGCIEKNAICSTTAASITACCAKPYLPASSRASCAQI